MCQKKNQTVVNWNQFGNEINPFNGLNLNLLENNLFKRLLNY